MLTDLLDWFFRAGRRLESKYKERRRKMVQIDVLDQHSVRRSRQIVYTHNSMFHNLYATTACLSISIDAHSTMLAPEPCSNSNAFERGRPYRGTLVQTS